MFRNVGLERQREEGEQMRTFVYFSGEEIGGGQERRLAEHYSFISFGLIVFPMKTSGQLLIMVQPQVAQEAMVLQRVD